MSYKLKKIYYLQDGDFSEDGTLKIPHNKPVIVGVVASWCGFCQRMKPEFQEFAEKYGGDKVYVAIMQTDGETPEEKKLGSQLRTIVPNFQGFPTIVKFKDGKIVEYFEDERTVEGFKRFADK